MSDRTTLERIGELEAKLAPIGSKISGMPIEADDWNALVSTIIAVLGIERIQEDSTRALVADQYALKDHKHLGQVTIDWLDDDLRTRIGGGGTVIAMQRTIDALSKKVDELSSEVTRLRTASNGLQIVVDRFSVNDVDRAKALRTISARFDTLGDFGTQVLNLRRDFGELAGSVGEVRDLRNRLLDGQGQPLDLNGIRNDVRTLQTLAQNFNGIDDQPVRLRDIELQLRELKDVAGVGEGLDVRFTTFEAKVEERVVNTVKTQVNDARTTISAEIREDVGRNVKTAVDVAAGAQTTQLDLKFVEAERRLATSLSTSLLNQIRDDQVPKFRAVDEKLAQLDPRITNAIAGLRGELATSVENAVRPKISAEVQTGINRTATELGNRITATEGAFNDLRTRLPANILATVQNETRNLQINLGEQVNRQVEGAQRAINESLPALVDRATSTAIGNLDQRIAGGVAAAVGDLPGRIRDEVSTQTRNVIAQVGREVTAQLGAANIPAQVRQATAGISGEILATVNTRLGTERTQTTREVNEAKADLQRQIIAEVANGKNSAIAEAKTLVEGVRRDSNRRIDDLSGVVANLPRGVVNPVIVNPVVIRNPQG